jgi:hypothetical protein
MYYWLAGKEEDARLIEALSALHQREFQKHLQIPFAEFDKRIRERRSSNHGNRLQGHGFQE